MGASVLVVPSLNHTVTGYDPLGIHGGGYGACMGPIGRLPTVTGFDPRKTFKFLLTLTPTLTVPQAIMDLKDHMGESGGRRDTINSDLMDTVRVRVVALEYRTTLTLTVSFRSELMVSR